MILQALTQYYGDLLAQGVIARPGWATAKVSYALDLGDDGQLLGLLHLQREVLRGKKTVLVPQEVRVPQPVKKTSNTTANFLCDSSAYLLGADAKGKPERTARCFAAARELHARLLQGAQSPAARAVLAYFDGWNPASAAGHPALQQDWDDLMKGGSLVFWHRGRPVADDPEVQACWQRACGQSDGGEQTLCLVTGQRGPAARLHPNIKGVVGAKASGAALVSFNAPAFCSYGHEQGANAPTGADAAFAYTTALNHLISDREHTCCIPRDTTIVCWAAGGEPAYQDCMMAALYSDTATEQDIRSTLFGLTQGKPMDWQGQTLDPNTRFYVLGLAPNAARLSVRFFWQNSFATLARNVSRHYERLEIVRPGFDPRPTLSVWQLVLETVRDPHTPEPMPRLAGDLLLAVLNDGLYPATLLDGVVLRIRAERKVTRGRAAILKAWYLRNSQDEQIKEVMTVQLNEQSNYLPYLLGRLFSVLEAVQQQANPGINTTITDRYFNTASSTPAMVFPVLLNLAQKHLAKLPDGSRIFYNKKITELNARIDRTLPARMTLPEQSAFQIGYYHETQKRYTKKEELYHV